MHESIELQMSLLLAVALAGHLLSSLVRQPAVVGQILAGLMVGPSVFGWITYTDFVANIAHLGAIVLLFVVGLEFRARELAAVRPFLIAVAGVVVPSVCRFWASVFCLALVNSVKRCSFWSMRSTCRNNSISASLRASPGGQPSTIQPSAGP